MFVAINDLPVVGTIVRTIIIIKFTNNNLAYSQIRT